MDGPATKTLQSLEPGPVPWLAGWDQSAAAKAAELLETVSTAPQEEVVCAHCPVGLSDIASNTGSAS